MSFRIDQLLPKDLCESFAFVGCYGGVRVIDGIRLICGLANDQCARRHPKLLLRPAEHQSQQAGVQQRHLHDQLHER